MDLPQETDLRSVLCLRFWWLQLGEGGRVNPTDPGTLPKGVAYTLSMKGFVWLGERPPS